MDLDKVKETGDKAGSAIDSLWNGLFTKFRWLKLLIMFISLGCAYLIYDAIVNDIEPLVEETTKSLWEWDLNSKGDTLWYYDGVLTK